MKHNLHPFKRIFCILLSLTLFASADTLTYAESTFAETVSDTEAVIHSASADTEAFDDLDSTDTIASGSSDSSDTEASGSSDSSDTEAPGSSDSTDTEASGSSDSTDTEAPDNSDSTDTEAPGSSDSSDTETSGDKPSAPQTVTLTSAVAGNYASILLKWNPISGASGYIIERQAENESSFREIATVTDGTAYTDTKDVAAGCTYTYRIYAFITYITEDNQTASVNGAYSNTLSARPVFTNGVTSFRAESNGYESVILNWNPTDGASGYNIYRSTKSSSGFTKIATVNAPASSYVSGSLTTGKKYYYRIEAFRTIGAFTSTASISASVNATPIPGQAVLTASLRSYTSALLKWKKVSGANGYEIYRSRSKNGTYKKIATISKNTTTYADKNLNTGSTYYYKIKAYRNVKGKKVWGKLSLRASVKITLKAPVLRSTVVKNYKSLTLRWKKVSGADGYLIYRSTSKNGSYKKIATVTGGSTLTYTNTGLSTGKTYYYKIQAYQRSGKKTINGNYSAVISKATSLKKVSGVTATPQHSNKIKLEWKKVSGATSYNIYRSASKNGTYTQIKSGVKSTSYTDNNLTEGKRYYYKICAKKGSVTGSRSSYASAVSSALKLSQTSVTVQKRFSVTRTFE